jgi:hypothetical protein
MNCFSKVLLNVVWRVAFFSATQVSAQMPPATMGSEATEIVTLHAEGAQIYECKPDSTSNSEGRASSWQFREPIATLILDGTSIGRHYAGPSWVHADGSEVKGRVVGSAPGTTSNDIPWLNLEAVDHRGNVGILSGVTRIQRINTKGGMVQGSCERTGTYRSVPYSADYVFLRART